MDQGQGVGLAWHFDGDFYWHDGRDPGISILAYLAVDP
jgi:hypothetical protein